MVLQSGKFRASTNRDIRIAVSSHYQHLVLWIFLYGTVKKAAEIIGKTPYVNAPADVIEARLMGDYNLGCDQGTEIYTDDYMLFHRGGETNFPRKSHAIWFMSQYMRFDYLKEAPAAN